MKRQWAQRRAEFIAEMSKMKAWEWYAIYAYCAVMVVACVGLAFELANDQPKPLAVDEDLFKQAIVNHRINQGVERVLALDPVMHNELKHMTVSQLEEKEEAGANVPGHIYERAHKRETLEALQAVAGKSK